jgi:hypothetical protein
MARSTYFDLGRSADARPGSESGYAQRFQCGNIVKRRIWTRMTLDLVTAAQQPRRKTDTVERKFLLILDPK